MLRRRPYSILSTAKSYFATILSDPQPTPEAQSNPYISYPLVTAEQLKQIDNESYRFEFGYASYAHHSARSGPMIHSLSDLTVPTDLTSLLPKRRPHGSPVDTLSIRAGDDAMLVSPTVLAVADGVSGWDTSNSDTDGCGEPCTSGSGIFSRSMLETLSRLMTEYKLSHAPHHLNNRDIEQILNDSYLHTSHLMDLQGLQGSSTLLLAMLSGDTLKTIAIGDSKLYIVRNGAVVKSSDEQLVSPLCPKQIGTQTLGQLPSEMALVESTPLQEDDVVVLCSDGVSDNLYEHEILKLVVDGDNVRKVAADIIKSAKEIAFDDYAYTPYNEKVEKTGVTSRGGKVDDMSVCVARIGGGERDGVSSDDL